MIGETGERKSAVATPDGKSRKKKKKKKKKRRLSMGVRMTGAFSKFTVSIPTRYKRASTIARVLTHEWIYRYGVHRRIHTDQGRFFRVILSRRCAQHME